MLEQSFSASDDITGAHLDDIHTCLQAETAVPEGFLTAVQADKLLVYLLDVNNNILRLSSCIVVHSDPRVTVSLNQAAISESCYEDLSAGSREWFIPANKLNGSTDSLDLG